MMALRLSGLRPPAVSQLGCATTGLELDEVVVASNVDMAFVATEKPKVVEARAPVLQSDDGRMQGTSSAQAYLWRNFFEDPTQWWDSRRNKRNPKDPDFRHARTLQVLWIDNHFKPAWVGAKLRLLQDAKAGLFRARWAPSREGPIPAVAPSRVRVTAEGLLPNYFNDPSEWWDNRKSKLYLKPPVFRHKSTRDALWLDSWDTAQWVAQALEERAFEKTAGGSSKTGPAVHDECKPGNTVDFRLPEVDELSWTALISKHTKRGLGRQALKIYREMRESGMRLSSHTFVAALKACSSIQDLESVKRVHTEAVECGFESDVYVGTMLVDVYAKCGCLVDARCVFEKISHRNVVSWNAMILGYAQLGEGPIALQLYRRMQQEGVTPDDRTFVCALKACSSLAALEEGVKVDGRLVKIQCLEQVRAIQLDTLESGCELDLFVHTMLVDVYAKCGSLIDARRVFDKMPHRDVVSWNAMIMGYAHMDEGEEALQLYERMQQEGVTPDDRTLVGALKACGNVVGLEKGREIHAEIAQMGLEATDSFVASSLVDMYAKCGSMVDSQRVFDALPFRNIVTWSALIAGYARQGKSDIVFSLFQRMRQQGIKPNGITFLSVLAVCSHEGLVAEGQKYFEAMSTDFGISPTMEHYTCMIDLLGRAGQVDDATAMAKAMPFQADCAVWESVLGACRKWGKVDKGRQAFDYAVRSCRTSAAAYMLMANIYAAAHMWESVKEIQAMRDKTQVWKQPGQSLCLDFDGCVHTFEVRDQEHPKRQHIHAKLGYLFDKMNDEGNGPHSYLDIAKCF